MSRCHGLTWGVELSDTTTKESREIGEDAFRECIPLFLPGDIAADPRFELHLLDFRNLAWKQELEGFGAGPACGLTRRVLPCCVLSLEVSPTVGAP